VRSAGASDGDDGEGPAFDGDRASSVSGSTRRTSEWRGSVMATLPSATASRGRCCVDAQAVCLPQHGFPSDRSKPN
jgi:hypothetical protein